jgi:N-acyl-D-amino-acid deacylase
MTHVAMMLPMEFQTGSPKEMLAKLQRPDVREKSLAHLREKFGRGDQIVGNTRSGRFIGMTLAEAAAQERKSWEVFAYDLVVVEETVEAFVFPWQTPPEENEITLDRTAPHPRMMIASDGVYNVPHPHPRGHGCFVQFLRRFVREKGLVSLKDAVYKMSGFPAQRFGLKDRGRIAEGFAADLVVFDAETVADASTWQQPLQPAVGVESVLVNGVPVIEAGEPTQQLPGCVLRHSP